MDSVLVSKTAFTIYLFILNMIYDMWNKALSISNWIKHILEKTVYGQNCAPQFIYNNKTFTGCTGVGNSGRPWCSLTDNYDRDGQWTNCQLPLQCLGTTDGMIWQPSVLFYIINVNFLQSTGSEIKHKILFSDDGNCLGKFFLLQRWF